ncbi:MAG: sigma-B regulation protein RsbU (phosphoserine phosphatase) [Marinobacter psychrophilus]|jgi:sigma-B regulation protein RsbU (phosphoserine phosphatase)
MDEQSKPVILAVDDTPENLDVVRGLLAPEYQVKMAPSGKIALKIAESQQPDLILLDIMMPDMDGYEVCRRLKRNPITADIPVIFLTAKGETADEAEGFEIGAADYIHKPVNPPILKARVKTHLALKQNMDALQQTTAALAQAKEKMEKELNVGKQIQLSMLPTSQPDDDAFTVAATMRAALQVGGDLYDYFFISPREFCVCIGDVSDKGVPASLFMAVTKTLLRANASNDISTASILTRINDELAVDNESCMFVTMFLAICDLQTGNVRYTNAGHNPPFIKRADGEIVSITGIHGPVAGAVEGLAYKQSELQLKQGDLLFLYTDGVSEAMNANDAMFEEKQIADQLVKLVGNDPAQAIEAVLSAVDEFAAGCEQSDDITMLGFRFEADNQAMAQHNIELTLTNQLSEIDRINDSFNEFAESAEIPMGVSLKINMVFDELLNNIISYAYEDQNAHDIRIRVDLISTRLVITIEDDGVPFNPFMRAEPDTDASLEDREIGGLGIHLVKKVMSEVSYKRHFDRNRLTLIKQLDE